MSGDKTRRQHLAHGAPFGFRVDCCGKCGRTIWGDPKVALQFNGLEIVGVLCVPCGQALPPEDIPLNTPDTAFNAYGVSELTVELRLDP